LPAYKLLEKVITTGPATQGRLIRELKDNATDLHMEFFMQGRTLFVRKTEK